MYLVTTNIALSQRQVIGYVIDTKNNPLVDVTVQVIGTDIEVRTDQEGMYEIELPALINTIEYSKSGFSSYSFVDSTDSVVLPVVSLFEIDYMEIGLDELLNAKVVTANKFEQKVENVPANVIVITRKEIEIYGYNSLEEILQSVPGLYLVEQYNWSGMTGFGVRGYFAEGSFSNMIVMINGSAASREGYINQYILARIGVPVEAIESIEIIRGPMSVIYGSGAFFGAINIITKSKTDKPQNYGSFSYGANNSQRTNLEIQTNYSDLSFDLNVGLFSTDGINQPYIKMTSNPIITNSNGDKQTYLQSLGIPDDKTTDGQLSQIINYFSVNAEYKNFSFDINTTHAEKGLIWAEPSNDPKGQNVIINGSDARLQYSNKLTDKFQFSTIFTYGIFNSISRYDTKKTSGSGFSNIYSSTWLAEVNSHYKLKENLEWSCGIVAQSLENPGDDVDIPNLGVGNSSFRIRPYTSIKDYEAYSQLSFMLIPKLNFILGARASKFGNYFYQRVINEGLKDEKLFEKEYIEDKVHFTYRAAIIYNATKNHSFKAMYGTGILTPNLRQNVTRMDLSGGDRSQLDPSRITTYELIYNSNFAKRIYILASLFHNKLDKLIESSGALDSNGTYYVLTQNSGEMQTYGSEFTLNYIPHQNFDIQVSATYQKSFNLREMWEDIELPYSPKWLANIKLTYKFNENIFASLYGYYVDSMQTSWKQIELDPRSGSRYGKSSPGYFNFSTNILYKDILESKINLNLSIYNLLNTEIMYPTDPSNAWADKGFIGLGLRWEIRMTYDF